MAIDAVYTSNTFNSYITDVEATALVAALAVVLGGDEGYAALSNGSREALILESAKAVNAIAWEGERVGTIVAPTMQFPRAGLVYPTGVGVPANAIPAEIKDFCAAWIVYQLRNSKLAKNVAPLKSKSVGGVSVTWSTHSGTVKPAWLSAMGKVPAGWYVMAQAPGISNASINRRF